MLRKLTYEVELPENVNDILSRDFWVFDGVTAPMLDAVTEPMKFTSVTSVFLRRGECEAVVDLRRFRAKAPCFINIREGQILQKESVSSDFEAACVVFSKRLSDALFMHINDAYPSIRTDQVSAIPESETHHYEELYSRMRALQESGGQLVDRAVLHLLAYFFFSTAAKNFTQPAAHRSSAERLVDLYLSAVQERFRTDRRLDSYATELGVTAKHLSRCVKRVTGYTAGEWIERYLILEAKVLLKSTNMTVQQISDELGFSSQSFFGKYFKGAVGLSPREYRNSQ